MEEIKRGVNRDGREPKEYTGTDAERLEVPTNQLIAGDKWHVEHDTEDEYVASYQHNGTKWLKYKTYEM